MRTGGAPPFPGRPYGHTRHGGPALPAIGAPRPIRRCRERAPTGPARARSRRARAAARPGRGWLTGVVCVPPCRCAVLDSTRRDATPFWTRPAPALSPPVVVSWMGVCWRSLQPAWVGTGNVEWGLQLHGKKMIRRDGSRRNGLERLASQAGRRGGCPRLTCPPGVTSHAQGQAEALAGGVPPAFAPVRRTRHASSHPHVRTGAWGGTIVICGFFYPIYYVCF